MKYILLLILAIQVPCFAASHGTAAGKVKSVSIKETGNVFVRFESDHANTMQCGIAHTIMIENGNPHKKEMISFALMAFAVGSQTSFWVTRCDTAYGSTYSVATTAGLSK